MRRKRALPMPARSTLPRLIAVLALLLITAQAAIPLRISHAQSGPVFTIEAPSRIGVGEPFTIGLRVRGVADLGGFETTVLFDADAVEFQGFDPSENDLDRKSVRVGKECRARGGPEPSKESQTAGG